jgi:hypothetical protein
VTKTQAERMAAKLNGSLQSYMTAHVHTTKDGLIHFVSVRDKADESIEYLHSPNDKLAEFYFKTGKENHAR